MKAPYGGRSNSAAVPELREGGDQASHSTQYATTSLPWPAWACALVALLYWQGRKGGGGRTRRSRRPCKSPGNGRMAKQRLNNTIQLDTPTAMHHSHVLGASCPRSAEKAASMTKTWLQRRPCAAVVIALDRWRWAPASPRPASTCFDLGSVTWGRPVFLGCGQLCRLAAANTGGASQPHTCGQEREKGGGGGGAAGAARAATAAAAATTTVTGLGRCRRRRRRQQRGRGGEDSMNKVMGKTEDWRAWGRRRPRTRTVPLRSLVSAGAWLADETLNGLEMVQRMVKMAATVG